MALLIFDLCYTSYFNSVIPDCHFEFCLQDSQFPKPTSISHHHASDNVFKLSTKKANIKTKTNSLFSAINCLDLTWVKRFQIIDIYEKNCFLLCIISILMKIGFRN